MLTNGYKIDIERLLFNMEGSPFFRTGHIRATFLRHKLFERKFQLQESPYTELFETTATGRTIYNLFTATFLFMLITSLMKDYITQREIGVFQFINIQFKKLDIAFFIWLGYNAVAFFTYFCFKLWASIRYELKPTNFRMWDNLWMIILCALYVTPFFYAHQLSAVSQMGAASVGTLTLELLRFLMKIHAFIRSNAPKVLKWKRHGGKASDLPKFTTFLHFLYVPTFIYRNEYPRSDKIRRSFMVCRIIEMAVLIIFVAMCFVDGFIPMFQEFCTRKYRSGEIVLLCLQAGIIGAWVTWATQVIMFHSVQNIVGELLSFGDRSFYSDWWSCCNYKEFFRKWNFVVSDWLYLYIFNDMYKYIAPGRYNCAKLITFLISIIVHEWMILMFTGIILPICGLLFLWGCLVSIFLPNPKNEYCNIIFFFNKFLGLGLIFTLISLEHHARVNLKLSSIENLPVMFTNCTIW